jgi:haloalkane dehalogenase
VDRDGIKPDPQGRNDDWRTLYPFVSRRLPVGDGVSCHYVDEGEGAPVVMVHGNPTWSFYYRELIRELRTEWRIVAPDHIGCGLSDKPEDYPYRLDRHVANLERLVVEHLDLRDITLVVHDWGGAIGMGVAVRHPERIRRLVLLNTAAFLVPWCPLRIRVCRWPVLGRFLVRRLNGFSRAALTMAVANRARMTPAIRAGYLAPYDSYAHRVAVHRFVLDIPLRPTHPTWATLAAIESQLGRLADRPVLACWGDRDFCFTPRFLSRWQEIYPQAAVHRFADAGHYVLEDAGDRVLAAMRTFLQPT